MPDEQVLAMATIEGAKCLLKEDEIGSLEVGKKADVVLLKNRSTVPVFEANVVNYVVGTCERTDVDTVVIDGEVVLREGEFVKVDEEQALAHCREEAIELWRGNDWPLP
jgi:cytosine/adenosine deaminase-related metal-dependent hydrolase